jgi:hypothetical protein
MSRIRTVQLLAVLICLCSLLAAQIPPLTIADEPLPEIDAGVEFHVFLHAAGGLPPYVWSVVNGDLPDGITLTPEGLLGGRPAKPGNVAFSLKVEDSGHPARALTKDFQFEIAAPLLIQWLDSPAVHDNRIDGALTISNGSKDAFDLTVVVVAVADNGRATAIGYEHFPMKAGVTDFKIPFGNTLPKGGYVIHADAIAEIPTRNTILRQRLQTPQALQVLQGP